MKKLFSGSCVALITPFKNGKVDFKALKNLINFQLENKTDAIVILGTTGEPATMSSIEKCKIIEFAKNLIKNRAILIVGTGSNSTEKTIEESKIAFEKGADGLLIVTPYYNKCTQNGLIKHYEKIASEVDLPIIVYNVPSRTGVNISPETMLKLANIPQIYGLKEASGNISQIVKLSKLLKDKIAIYSGDDSLNYIFMCLGASGVISVTANVFPKQVRDVVELTLNGNYEKARKLHEELLEVNNNLFLEVNPIPIKYACSFYKMCKNELRLPLTKMNKNNSKVLRDSLIKFNNLSKDLNN